jgi:hypothetical protein
MSFSTVFAADGAAGRPVLAVLAVRSYRFRPNARAEAVPTAQEDLAGSLASLADAFVVVKSTTDVVVKGYVYGFGSTSVEALVEVGPTKKVLRAYGERRIEVLARPHAVDLASVSFSAPAGLGRVALAWEHAYGGGRAHHYPRNPAGRGFFTRAEDPAWLHDTRAPSFEDPLDPVTPDRLAARNALDWIDRPAAACFAPLDLHVFPRSLFAIPPPFTRPARPVYEVALGALREEDLRRSVMDEVDDRLANIAAPGLAAHRLHGAEVARLRHLHPHAREVIFALPGDVPRVAIEPPNAGVHELRPQLATVLIEPEIDRVTLTWCASLPVAAPYPDAVLSQVRHAVIWPRKAVS